MRKRRRCAPSISRHFSRAFSFWLGEQAGVLTCLDTLQVTKVQGGETIKETKKWSYYELSDYKYMTYAQLAAKVKDVASALVETGHTQKTVFNIYASTGPNWQVMANGELVPGRAPLLRQSLISTRATACASQGITFATAYDNLGSEGVRRSLAAPGLNVD